MKDVFLAKPVIHRETVEKQIYEYLRQAILERQLAGGQRLVQDVLANEFGTSRIPVRDALKKLEADGLVTVGDNGSHYVHSFKIEELEEIYKLRMLLEPYAAVNALPRLNEHDLEDIRELLKELGKAAQDEDNERYVALNYKFHMSIYEASKQPRLIRIIKSLWSGRPIFNPLEISGDFGVSIREHELIFQSIVDKNAQALEESIRIHIGNSLKMLCERLASKELAGAG